MHLTLNLSLTLRDRPLVEAVAAAAEAGFRNIEFWWPSAGALAGATLEDLAAAIRERGLVVDLMNVPAGDMAAGDRGIATDPGRSAEFRAGVEEAVAFAATLGVPRVNVLAGKVVPGQSPEDALATGLENLAWAVDRAGQAGIAVVVEPLNLVENQGYVFPTVDAISSAISSLGRTDVGVLLDVYHVAMAGEDPVTVIRDCTSPIGHVQLADHPCRHEPGSASLDFPGIIAALRPVYDGGLGVECLPQVAGAPDFDLIRATLATA